MHADHPSWYVVIYHLRLVGSEEEGEEVRSDGNDARERIGYCLIRK
jgi:hypothetical protein